MTAFPLFPHRLASRLCSLFVLVSFFPGLHAAPAAPGAALAAELRALEQTGSVLYVAAHPDDENTQLITYLARGRGYRTAYLSLTRGDGGQNVLGPDLGEKLGVARTQELLAARRLDSGRQFFTRAIDFGFSKDYEETLRVWDRQKVLSDVVRVIRTFRPDVIVTRFSPQPGGTHGHHTASAVLALEAFRLAADPTAFPEQLGELKPWQARRILWNAWPARSDMTSAFKMDVNGTDPVLGITFSELATRSRSQHKTQGFDKFTPPPATGPRWEHFNLLAGDPATTDLMDGVDTTWNRYAGGAALAARLAEVRAQFDPARPGASLPALLKLRTSLEPLPADPVVNDKRAALDRLIAECAGLTVRTTVPRTEVVAGESLALHQEVASAVPLRWRETRFPRTGRVVPVGLEVKPGAPATRDLTQALPADAPVSQPYWLRTEPTTGTFAVEDPRLIGEPENPPEFPIEQVFEIDGQTLVVADEPILAGTQPGTPGVRHLTVIAPVSLRFAADVELLAPGATREVALDLTAARSASGVLRLELPEGWQASPTSRAFTLAPGATTRCTFSVTAPRSPDVAAVQAAAEVAGRTYRTQRVEVQYPHIHYQLLQPVARARFVALEIARRGQRIGYVPGAGDTVADNLRQIGYDVTALAGPDLTPENLKRFDAVVLGVRALNVRTDLAPHMAALFDYVAAGGNLLYQYNNPNGLQVEKTVPFELKISGDRVTDETAPMTFLAPEHPAFTTPNAITGKDFEGWVQERGLYFPSQWDPAFTPLLACNDRGEPPTKGALLVARHGRGHIVYTGLSFFRQLPAGVPGAYRLFANLVSLGK